MNCLNCNNNIQIEQKFCPECGQKTSTARLNTSDILHDAFHAFTHTDKGILFLLRWLIVKPGTISREYVLGKRKKYFNPFTFLILIVGITTILATKFNLMDQSSQNATIIGRFLSKYFNLVIFLIVPIIAFFTKMVFGSKKINFAESIILCSYTSGERSMFYILLVAPLIIFFREYYSLIIGSYLLLFTLYFAFACSQYFSDFKVKNFLKGILIIVLSQVTITTIIGFGTFIFMKFIKH